METVLNQNPAAAAPAKAPSGSPSVPLRERINLRMIAFAAVLLFLVGTPLYILVRQILTGGIVNRGDVTYVDLKAMSDFEMNPATATDQDIPTQFRGLDGKRVQLEGEMYVATGFGSELGEFDLVWSRQKCCFSGPPKVQHFVKSKVVDGGKVPYYGNMVKVTGTLHVGMEKRQGVILSVYRLDVERVDPA